MQRRPIVSYANRRESRTASEPAYIVTVATVVALTTAAAACEADEESSSGENPAGSSASGSAGAAPEVAGAGGAAGETARASFASACPSSPLHVVDCDLVTFTPETTPLEYLLPDATTSCRFRLPPSTVGWTTTDTYVIIDCELVPFSSLPSDEYPITWELEAPVGGTATVIPSEALCAELRSGFERVDVFACVNVLTP